MRQIRNNESRDDVQESRGIDRPTCRNECGISRSFSCSACGYEAWTYDDSECDPSDFEYCPECGAKVVHGNE